MMPRTGQLEALGLEPNGKAAGKKSTKKTQSDVQKMIPPRSGRGRRTAQEEQAVRWICAAGEAMYTSRENNEFPSVACLPFLLERVEVPAPPVPAPVVNGTPARSGVFTIDSTIREEPEPKEEPAAESEKIETPPVSNGVLVGKTERVASLPEVHHADSDLDKDLLEWMEEGFRRYIRIAGLKSNEGPWAYRMARMAVGLDVMAQGSRWVRDCFERFVGALFELLDAARSLQDLGKLEFLIEHAVYFDVLAEIANFQTKSGHVSTNIQSYYDDKVLTLMGAS